MLCKTIALNELAAGWSGSAPQSSVTFYLQQPYEIEPLRRHPCVVICPGGGYRFVSPREAEPIALRYAAMGYSAAVVNYSSDGYSFPTQLCELSLVMAALRRNAQEWYIDPERIAVCGFSAGGHLAASLCNLWNLPQIGRMTGVNPGENRPNAAVLCYPVITSGEFANKGSFEHLLSDFSDPEITPLLSLENSVNKDCPPTFLWHTADDDVVPVENTLLYATALRRCNIPMELHIFPHGPHGLSLADFTTTAEKAKTNPQAANWHRLSINFLDSVLRVERY